MPKRALPSTEHSQITEKVLFKIASDLEKGIPAIKDKLSIVDDLVIGLRFIIYKNAEIAVHASYTVGDRRPFMKLGVLSASAKASREPSTNEPITLAEARELTRAIKAIGDRGIDIEKASRMRLMAEIKRDGGKWSPTLSPPARKG